MFQCTEWYLTKTVIGIQFPWISVAFFDHVALFSDFDHLFEWLGPGFAPYSSSAHYIIRIKFKNIVKNAPCQFYEQFSCPERMLLIQSLWVECKVCLSHAGSLRWRNLFLVMVQSAILVQNSTVWPFKWKPVVLHVVKGRGGGSTLGISRWGVLLGPWNP